MPSCRGRNKGRGMGEVANEVTEQRNLIDINVASAEELSTLVGVGRSRAEAIVETRNVSCCIRFHRSAQEHLTKPLSFFLLSCSHWAGLLQLKI